jgi:pantoate--beta-alanine ligase
MKIIESTDAAHAHVRKRTDKSVLVPTMGALHRGHLELIRVARGHAGNDGEVAVSIFVNPLQFEAGSDFEKYPRPQSTDEKFCEDAGVNLLFRPREMYFDDRSVYVEEKRLSAGLCGASRPGHFQGVCTVVAKLFNLLAPTAAVFGEKDYQQLAIIRRMVRDLNFPIEIIGVPTVREADGLALSSRNQYLNSDERAAAPALYQAMLRAKELAAAGGQAGPDVPGVPAHELLVSDRDGRGVVKRGEDAPHPLRRVHAKLHPIGVVLRLRHPGVEDLADL